MKKLTVGLLVGVVALVILVANAPAAAQSQSSETKLLPSDGEASDFFGYSVAVSGDTAVVGARYDGDNGTGSGSAYVFERNEGGTGSWGQVAKL